MAIPKRLRVSTGKLYEALVKLERDLPANVAVSGDFLHSLFARITFVNETLTLALKNFADVHLSCRPKRGLIDGLSHLFRYLFGTAMDSDAQELREKYTYLISVAEAQNKAINLNCRHLACLELKLQDVANHANTLRNSLNTVLQSLNSLCAFEVFEQAVTFIRTTNNQILQNLVDASCGWVISNLFPFQDL